MKNKTLNKTVKVIFTLFMIISASGELTMNEAVVHSMEIIGMPIYLLYFLGVLKIAGLLAIWFSPYLWIKEWAYAGFVFDFVGAIFCFIMVRQLILPDIIMAPLGLVLCVFLYINLGKT